MECTATRYVLLYLSMAIGVFAGLLFAALAVMSRRESDHHDDECERRVLARQTDAAGARFETLRNKRRADRRVPIAQQGASQPVIP
jgi:hypothetical protein